MNADFCIGTTHNDENIQFLPVTTLLDMSHLLGYNDTSVLRQALVYYGNVCFDGRLILNRQF
jgi:hypothetical protein